MISDDKSTLVQNDDKSTLVKLMSFLFQWQLEQPCWVKQVLANVNTSPPRTKWPPFTDDNFKGIFLNENVSTVIKISLKFVSTGPINNIPALIQIMAWHRTDDKPLSEPVMVSSLTHICITWPLMS